MRSSDPSESVAYPSCILPAFLLCLQILKSSETTNGFYHQIFSSLAKMLLCENHIV